MNTELFDDGRQKSWARLTLEHLAMLAERQPKSEVIVNARSLAKDIGAPKPGVVSAALGWMAKKPINHGTTLLILVGKEVGKLADGHRVARLYHYKLNREQLPVALETKCLKKRPVLQEGIRSGHAHKSYDDADIPTLNSSATLAVSKSQSSQKAVKDQVSKITAALEAVFPKVTPKNNQLVNFLLDAAIQLEEQGSTRELMIAIVKHCVAEL